MTSDPDAVTTRSDKIDSGDLGGGRDDVARAARGRSAKLLPPTDPIWTLARPLLEQHLVEGTERRLTVVSGGAEIGVTGNGVVAAVQGSTFAAMVPVAPPSATLTAVATSQKSPPLRVRACGVRAPAPLRP